MGEYGKNEETTTINRDFHLHFSDGTYRNIPFAYNVLDLSQNHLYHSIRIQGRFPWSSSTGETVVGIEQRNAHGIHGARLVEGDTRG